MNNRIPLPRHLRALLPCSILLAGMMVLVATRPLQAVAPNQQPQPAPAYWTPLVGAAAPQTAAAPLPARYQLWQLNLPQMESLLASAPLADVNAGGASFGETAPIVVSLPLGNGEIANFAVVDAPIMEPGLAAQFPDFRTLAGRAVDDPATTVRLGVTTLGFHATIWSVEGTTWIDPLNIGETETYLVYDASDALSSGSLPELPPRSMNAQDNASAGGAEILPIGNELLTYRIAVSATGEYTQFFGGTVPNAMAAIVTAMNRLDGIYMRELAIHLVLVANNNLLVYTNALSDPFTNDNADALLNENQELLDAVIGNTNYDIGHVFSTGAGGLASLGVVCETSFKAMGATGSSAPTGDPFWVDYVAHELGHQFNAEHTFNNDSHDACAGNRNGPTAWEPGSGSTIMSYAGICAAENLQANADDYFHIGSIGQIVAFTRFGDGNSCPVKTPTGNAPPNALVSNGAFTIPYFTPFTLPGGANDANGTASLTYTWEQLDLGPAGSYTAPVGDAPIIRSIAPDTTLASRTIPRMSSLVNNTWFQAESLPMTTRTMLFRFSVRDNNTGGGGVDSADLAVSVTTEAGPFAVTYPDLALIWLSGFTYAVTWSVADTNLAPVNCANVEIRLSTDGGLTYPIVLAASTPNDGSAEVAAPNLATAQARVRVKCLTNLFFDISNTNFTIDASTPALQFGVSATPPSGAQVQPGDEISYTLALTNDGAIPLPVELTNTFDPHLVNESCDGTPGNLVTNVALAALGNATIDCTTQVDPALAVQLSHRAQLSSVVAGSAVTFTVVVTNPTDFPMQNVVVTTNHGVACTPAIATPFNLGVHTSKGFTCPGVVVNSNTSFFAMVEAKMPIQNSASASAIALTTGRLDNNSVVHEILLEAEQDASVTTTPALTISKSVAPASALKPGDALTYTIQVANKGDVALATTTSDLFPAPLIDPVCNGVAGNLAANRTIAAQGSAIFVCAARIDPALRIQLRITAQQDDTAPGSPVTYTIDVANPNAVALSQVAVNAAQLQATCEANPATPFTLAPQAVKRFVCPVSSAITDISASATAQTSFTNVAQVSSAGVAGSPFSSAGVAKIVNLAATATIELRNYLTPINR